MRNVVIFFLAGCANGEAPWTEEATSGLRVDDLGRVTVDNGDGTWSHVLADDFDPDAELVERLITWRYAGQARYSIEQAPPYGTLEYVHQTKPQLTPSEKLMDSVRVDRDGRLWVPASVDESVDFLDYSTDEASGEELPDDETGPVDGETVEWTPLSWSKYDCEGDSDNDLFIWDTDDRLVDSTPIGRAKTAVDINRNCSGVMLRDTWVLTAAHCVYDSYGYLLDELDVDVNLDWIPGQNTVANMYFNGYSWGNDGWDPTNDYVLLELTGPFSIDPGDMDLSSAADSVLNDVGTNFHNLGYPNWLNACNTANSDLVHTFNNEVTATASDNLRLKGDFSGGQSGGPIYYCPDGDDTVCGSGDLGYVVAVAAGFGGYYNRVMGPRASNFRSWAIGIMP